MVKLYLIIGFLLISSAGAGYYFFQDDDEEEEGEDDVVSVVDDVDDADAADDADDAADDKDDGVYKAEQVYVPIVHPFVFRISKLGKFFSVKIKFVLVLNSVHEEVIFLNNITLLVSLISIILEDLPPDDFLLASRRALLPKIILGKLKDEQDYIDVFGSLVINKILISSFIIQ